jgi:hypothetical protein
MLQECGEIEKIGRGLFGASGLHADPDLIEIAFRLRHQEGYELANEALKRWLRQSRTPAAELLAMATKLGPKAAGPVRSTPQILL